MSAPADVAVVVATHDRADRLRRLLASLERQTVAPREVIVVDDGSADETPAVLRDHAGRLPLRVLRHDRAQGPAVAREAGWRAASAALVAFTDDDCVVTPGWVAGLLATANAHPGAMVMGPTRPDPNEAHLRSPFTRTLLVEEAGPPFQTCNILYPRELLERIGGFDVALPSPGAEDTDLGWRATEAGAACVLAPGAVVHHAVMQPGALGNLRSALRWERTVPVFKRHPGLRRAQLHRGVFFSPTHEHLLRALLAVALPRRLWPLSAVLAAPYARRLAWRRSGPLLAPYLLLYDVLEVLSILRGAIRERVLVL